jgi:hypothetical protein
MRTILACLALLLILPDADGQRFRPRYRPVCPDCTPFVPSRPYPEIAPEPSVPDPALTELDEVVPESVRVHNQNGNCVWCAAEDVFFGAGYEQCKGLMRQALEKGWHGAGIDDVLAVMQRANIPCKVERNRGTEIFEYARKEGVGVYIQIPGHALVCLGLTDRHAYILDNNGLLKIEKWARSKFDRIWEGVACCPFKRKRPKPTPPAVNPEPTVPAPTPIPAPTPKVDLTPVTDAISKLTERITVLEKTTGPAGPAGKDGRDGKDGANVDSSALVNQIASQITSLIDSKLRPLTDKLADHDLKINKYEVTVESLVNQQAKYEAKLNEAVAQAQQKRLASRIEQVRP